MTEEELERRLRSGELNEEILIAFKEHLLTPEGEEDIQPMLGKICDLAIEGYRRTLNAQGLSTFWVAPGTAREIKITIDPSLAEGTIEIRDGSGIAGGPGRRLGKIINVAS